MTQTTHTQTDPTAATFGVDIRIHPADILINLIVTFLAPMFLGASGGDIALARMAAFETVNAYRMGNHADLLAIAQIVACGLAALGSLSLSMADDISLSMTLRLRGNANALNRSAEQNRRAVGEGRSERTTPQLSEAARADTSLDPADADFEATVLANLADSQKRVADTQSRLQQPVPAQGTPVGPIVAGTVADDITEQRRQAMWAAAMTDVAGEFTASLHNLPPAERKMASMRAAALSSSANALLSGAVPPRLHPGAMDGGAMDRIMRTGASS
jgi:hypothetical protein